MSLARLHGIDPGRIGVFAGPFNAQPAAVQRSFAREMERLGYGTLWYGEALAHEAFARGAIYLATTERLVVASGIANIWARDAAAMANGGRTLAEAWPGRFILGSGSATRRSSESAATTTGGPTPPCASTSTRWTRLPGAGRRPTCRRSCWPRSGRGWSALPGSERPAPKPKNPDATPHRQGSP